MIFPQQHAIFFHVPRTAGYSMEQFILPGKRDYRLFHSDILFGINEGVMTQHLTYRGMLNYRDESFLNSHFKFSFFRNTWDRIASCFMYNPEHYLKKYGSFEKCLLSLYNRISNNENVDEGHFQPQTNYLFRNQIDGDLAVDFIGRYENLQYDFAKICSILEIPYKTLPVTNTPKKQDQYSSLYTNKTRELVEEMYSAEITYFKYSYPFD